MINRQSGFTLIELAVVLAIIGLVMGGSMAMMKPYVEAAQINATREKLNKIADSLAMFAQMHGRLPCPAVSDSSPGGGEPFGAPIGSDGPDGVMEECGTSVPDDFMGIVPFRALGLTEDNVRDGYGNLITYAVTPVMAGYTGGTGTAGDVHETCRTTRWIDSGSGTNLNPLKAQLCCPRWTGSNDNIEINDRRSGGDTVYSGEQTNGAAVYDDPNTIETTPNPSEAMNTHLIAFTLVSHGKNGDRARIKSAVATDRNIVTADAGAEESENHNDDLVFVDRGGIYKQVSNEYFDDIIVWRTNDQLVSAFGNDSCGRP